MKKILSFTAITLTAISLSNTAQAEGSSGCGLGNILLNGNRGVAANVLAVTTNGTSGNQTFGITTGTLGCNGNDVVRSTIKLAYFTDKNMDELAQDTAKGNGAYLEAAAQILEIKEKDKAHFFTVMQNNFSNIFPNENVKSDEVVASIEKAMQSDVVLKSYKI